MKQYYTLKKFKLFNSPFSIHWSSILVSLFVYIYGYKTPIHSLIFIICYFSIIVIHEIGHGYIASKLGYKVHEIKVSFLHGLCICEQPRNLKDQIRIAWGGVLAQVIVAVPLIILSNIKVLTDTPYLASVFLYLGYFNLLLALINLAPFKGMDGYIIWKIIPQFNYFITSKIAKIILRR